MLWLKRCCREEVLTPHTFERHQWQKSNGISIFYLVYKWCVTVQFVVVLICSIFNGDRYGKTDGNYWKWLIYLTNWGYFLCTAQSLLSLWIIHVAWLRKRSLKDGREEVPRHYRLYSALHVASVDVAFTVTSMYWFVVYNKEKDDLDIINILVHAGNSILMVIDLCLVAHPCTVLQGIYGVSVGSSYTLFSYIYHSSGGTDRKGLPFVYKALDWRSPGKAIIFAIICVGVVMMAHCLTWLMCRLRIHLGRSRRQAEPPMLTLGPQEKLMIGDVA